MSVSYNVVRFFHVEWSCECGSNLIRLSVLYVRAGAEFPAFTGRFARRAPIRQESPFGLRSAAEAVRGGGRVVMGAPELQAAFREAGEESTRARMARRICSGSADQQSRTWERP